MILRNHNEKFKNNERIKSNGQLQLPAPSVGWEMLQPLSASCQDGWLEKMTVISTACHQLKQPWEACYISVTPLEEEKSVCLLIKMTKNVLQKSISFGWGKKS